MKIPTRFDVRSLAVLVLSLGIMACSDAAPATAPTAVDVPGRVLTNATELLMVLDDIQDRVLPGFPADAARSELGATLAQLRGMIALAATDAAAVQRSETAVGQVRQVLQQRGPTFEQNGLSAEVDVISMSLDVVGESLFR